MNANNGVAAITRCRDRSPGVGQSATAGMPAPGVRIGMCCRSESAGAQAVRVRVDANTVASNDEVRSAGAAASPADRRLASAGPR